MMHFVYDNKIESIWRNTFQIHVGERLHRCEDLPAIDRFQTSDEQLAEFGVFHNVAEKTYALLQDLLPVGHEQQRKFPPKLAWARVTFSGPLKKS